MSVQKLNVAFELAYREVAVQEAAAAESCSEVPGYSSIERVVISDATARAAAASVGDLLSSEEEASLRRFRSSFGLSVAGRNAIDRALELPRETRANQRAICAAQRGRPGEMVATGAELARYGQQANNDHALGTGAVIAVAGLLDLFSPCEPD